MCQMKCGCGSTKKCTERRRTPRLVPFTFRLVISSRIVPSNFKFRSRLNLISLELWSFCGKFGGCEVKRLFKTDARAIISRLESLVSSIESLLTLIRGEVRSRVLLSWPHTIESFHWIVSIIIWSQIHNTLKASNSSSKPRFIKFLSQLSEIPAIPC